MATQPLQLDSGITRDQLEEAFLLSSGYQFPPDVQKAQNYIVAGTALLTLPLAEVDHAGERVRVEPRLIQEGVAKAERWLAVRSIVSMPPVSYAPAPDWRD